MVEKYIGLVPPGSVWYKLNRDEATAFLQKEGSWSSLTPEQQADIKDLDIQALPGKTEAFELLIKEAGLNITTLFD